MTTTLPVGKDLQKILQRVQPGFAYELLSLQIDLELQTTQNPVNNSFDTALHGRNQPLKPFKASATSDTRLMKKKHVVQQLHIASTGRHADQSALEEVFKAEIGQRKNELDLQIFLNKEQFDTKKIREIMKTADNKLKTFQKNIEKNLKKQDEELEQRKRIRKLKSDAGSVTKIDLDRYFQSPAKKFVIKSQKQLDQYFKIDPKPNQQKKRSGSIEKKQTQNSKISPNVKLKNLVI